MNIKTEHEFFSQVDVLIKASVNSPERLTKLGDMKSKWRAAKGNDVERSVLADALDAVAVEVRDEQKAATSPKATISPAPAAALKATTTPAPKPRPSTPDTPHPATAHD